MWTLLGANVLPLIIAFIIGLVTGWWAWARYRADAALDGDGSIDTQADAPAVAVEPPAPVVAAPVVPEPEPVAVAEPATLVGAAGAAAAGAAVVAASDADAEPKPEPKPKAAAKPKVAAEKPAATAALALTSIGIPAAVGDPDDLLKIKGIGPKLNGVLNGLGVTRFDQIAKWTKSDVDKVDDHLAEFKNRIGREEWIPQAKLLAAGKHAKWEELYGTAKAAASAAVPAMLAIGIPGAAGNPDNLLQIKGIGPKLNTLLTGLGITRFDQIAAWGAAEIDKVDDHLGTFKSRIGRDNWVEQAGFLAKGDVAGFEAKYGKLDSENQ